MGLRVLSSRLYKYCLGELHELRFPRSLHEFSLWIIPDRKSPYVALDLHSYSPSVTPFSAVYLGFTPHLCSDAGITCTPPLYPHDPVTHLKLLPDWSQSLNFITLIPMILLAFLLFLVTPWLLLKKILGFSVPVPIHRVKRKKAVLVVSSTGTRHDAY